MAGQCHLFYNDRRRIYCYILYAQIIVFSGFEVDYSRKYGSYMSIIYAYFRRLIFSSILCPVSPEISHFLLVFFLHICDLITEFSYNNFFATLLLKYERTINSYD